MDEEKNPVSFGLYDSIQSNISGPFVIPDLSQLSSPVPAPEERKWTRYDAPIVKRTEYHAPIVRRNTSLATLSDFPSEDEGEILWKSCLDKIISDFGGSDVCGTSDDQFQQENFKQTYSEHIDYDWNENYQHIYGRPRTNYADVRKHENILSELSASFATFASQVARIIIRQRPLPEEKRLFHPIQEQKGMAGGLKYKVGNVFFKYSVDNNQMYGSDSAAQKAAGNEIRAINAIVNKNINHLYVTLTLIVRYRGHAMVAQAFCPISTDGTDSLVYGSNDGGKTVVNSDNKLNALMAKLGNELNLKEHCVKNIPLYTAGDVEVHYSQKDKRYYVIDLARLFPPVPPRDNHHADYLYRQFRPEFIQKLDKPLSSDVFSGWGADRKDEHNTEARTAFNQLMDVTIKKFASTFEEHIANLEREHPAEVNEYIREDRFAIEMHKMGINLRYAGCVYDLLPPRAARCRLVLLHHMLARCIKVKFRLCLHQLSAFFVQDGPYLALASVFLFFLTGGASPAAPTDQPSAFERAEEIIPRVTELASLPTEFASSALDAPMNCALGALPPFFPPPLFAPSPVDPLLPALPEFAQGAILGSADGFGQAPLPCSSLESMPVLPSLAAGPAKWDWRTTCISQAVEIFWRHVPKLLHNKYGGMQGPSGCHRVALVISPEDLCTLRASLTVAVPNLLPAVHSPAGGAAEGPESVATRALEHPAVCEPLLNALALETSAGAHSRPLTPKLSRLGSVRSSSLSSAHSTPRLSRHVSRPGPDGDVPLLLRTQSTRPDVLLSSQQAKCADSGSTIAAPGQASDNEAVDIPSPLDRLPSYEGHARAPLADSVSPSQSIYHHPLLRNVHVPRLRQQRAQQLTEADKTSQEAPLCCRALSPIGQGAETVAEAGMPSGANQDSLLCPFDDLSISSKNQTEFPPSMTSMCSNGADKNTNNSSATESGLKVGVWPSRNLGLDSQFSPQTQCFFQAFALNRFQLSACVDLVRCPDFKDLSVVQSEYTQSCRVKPLQVQESERAQFLTTVRTMYNELDRKAFPVIQQAVETLCGENPEEYHDTMILTQLSKHMNHITVECFKNIDKDKDFLVSSGSNKQGQLASAMSDYQALHHMLRKFAVQYPSITRNANTNVSNFINDPKARVKPHTPDLGELIVQLLVSKYSWSDVAGAFLSEMFVRNVSWMLKAAPELGSVTADVSPCYRLTRSFESSFLSVRIIAFSVAVLSLSADLVRQENHVAETVLRPPDLALVSRLQAVTLRIARIENFSDFFCSVYVTPLSVANTDQFLLSSVYCAKQLGSKYWPSARDYSRDTALSTCLCLCKKQPCQYGVVGSDTSARRVASARYFKPEFIYRHDWEKGMAPLPVHDKPAEENWRDHKRPSSPSSDAGSWRTISGRKPQPSPAATTSKSTSSRSQACRFFNEGKGTCRNGNKCQFEHNAPGAIRQAREAALQAPARGSPPLLTWPPSQVGTRLSQKNRQPQQVPRDQQPSQVPLVVSAVAVAPVDAAVSGVPVAPVLSAAPEEPVGVVGSSVAVEGKRINLNSAWLTGPKAALNFGPRVGASPAQQRVTTLVSLSDSKNDSGMRGRGRSPHPRGRGRSK
jgi:hypothetical protein